MRAECATPCGRTPTEEGIVFLCSSPAGRQGGTFMIVKTSSASVVALDRCEVECVDPQRVASVRDRLPDDRSAQVMAEVFKLLSDPGRLRLILALLEAGELCVCELAAVTGLSETACSHNLRLLRSQRVVRYRKQGRNVYYALDDAHVRLLLDVALQHVSEAG